MSSWPQLFNALIAFLYLSVSAARRDLGGGNGKLKKKGWTEAAAVFLHYLGGTVWNAITLQSFLVPRTTQNKTEARNASKVDRNANQSHLCTQKAIPTGALHTDTGVSMKQDMDSIWIQNSRGVSTFVCTLHTPVSCVLLRTSGNIHNGKQKTHFNLRTIAMQAYGDEVMSGRRTKAPTF